MAQTYHFIEILSKAAKKMEQFFFKIILKSPTNAKNLLML